MAGQKISLWPDTKQNKRAKEEYSLSFYELLWIRSYEPGTMYEIIYT
jgi:hypothetical protein